MRNYLQKLILCLSTIFLVGCATAGFSTSGADRMGVRFVDPADADQLILENANIRRLRASFERTPADIYRSWRDLGWGQLRIELISKDGRTVRYATAAPTHFERDRIRQVRALALTPDGRTLEAHCLAVEGQSGPAQEIVVAVRAGPFGDASLEQQFLNMLAKQLAGKPFPVRNAGFELPPAK